MVTTSPGRTSLLEPSIRTELTRTSPAPASAAAAERVRTTRACHSHLSMRWRSIPMDTCPSDSSVLVTLQLLLQGQQLGKRRIRIRLLVAAAGLIGAPAARRPVVVPAVAV